MLQPSSIRLLQGGSIGLGGWEPDIPTQRPSLPTSSILLPSPSSRLLSDHLLSVLVCVCVCVHVCTLLCFLSLLLLLFSL